MQSSAHFLVWAVTEEDMTSIKDHKFVDVGEFEKTRDKKQRRTSETQTFRSVLKAAFRPQDKR
jgi:hypothetical protein